jgi:septum formation protein
MYLILHPTGSTEKGLRSVLQSGNMRAPVILLASNSPRRRQLLALGNWEFKVNPANIDEHHQPGESPAHYVLRLAETKARTTAVEAAAAAESQPGWLVVAADTIVVDHTSTGAEILEKPASQAEAFRMLAQLRGRSHQVYTALAVYDPIQEHLLTDLCITNVPMRAYTDDEITAYIASGDPMDKAGAYAIQNPQFQPVDHPEGCFASVMGLPLCHLQRTLRQFGVFPTVNLPQACQEAIHYNCPVYEEILENRESRFENGES